MFRPDPRDPAAVQRALFDLTDMVGDFEKPRYVDFKADLCAHSRSQKTGCTRCLDVCPASAIQPAGDVVAIDPFLCGGCGGCNSVCPTGAAAYAFPPTTAVLERLRMLLGTYKRAGGEAPVLLVHDEAHGFGLIGAMARAGRGLPARVIPFALNEVTQLGLDAILAAFAYGAERILFLIPEKRRDELSGLEHAAGSCTRHSPGPRPHRRSSRFPGRERSDNPSRPHLWDLAALVAHACRRFSAARPETFAPEGSALDCLHDRAPTKPERIPLPAMVLLSDACPRRCRGLHPLPRLRRCLSHRGVDRQSRAATAPFPGGCLRAVRSLRKQPVLRA